MKAERPNEKKQRAAQRGWIRYTIQETTVEPLTLAEVLLLAALIAGAVTMAALTFILARCS